MTEKYAEKISMLMDDELHSQEAVNLIDGIKHDEWLKQCWERYHLISDAMKNNLPSLVKHDLGNRLSAALEDEQTYRLNLHKPHHNNVTYLKPVMGLALAASVAVVAFLLAPWESATMEPSITPQQVAVQAPAPQLGGLLASDQLASGHTVSQPVMQTSRELKVEPVLYDYLVDHNEYTDSAYMQSSMMPYVRIVGYTSSADENH
jgi:sigma-E factor negative regulatory protein RseA